MTRSIFDPTGGHAEHSGNRNMGPQADNDSNLPDFLKEPQELATPEDAPVAPPTQVPPPPAAPRQ